MLSSADQVADRSNTARVLISSGYDVGSALLQVTQDEGEWKTDVIWTSKALKSKFSNFVVVGDYVYGFDNGLMTCISLADGRRSWKKGRYGHGQMLLVRDKLLIQAESGEVILVHPHPDGLRELTSFEASTARRGIIRLSLETSWSSATIKKRPPTNSQPTSKSLRF